MKPLELLTNNAEFFAKLNRTKFVPLLENCFDTDGFVELFFQKWVPGKSALVVVNTIKRSIDVFKRIKKVIQENEMKTDVFYLSTNIFPAQRKRLIANVKLLLEDERNKNRSLILVSTQTIEAGVDLDFDIGFRDLAPLTSLIQTAGRINRRGAKTTLCPLYIFAFENDSNVVYKLHDIDKTTEILRKYGEVHESRFRDMVEEYYAWLMGIGVSAESFDLWQYGLIEMNFEKLNSFSLIEQIGEVRDVYVETDQQEYGGEPGKLAEAYTILLSKNKDIDLVRLRSCLGDIPIKAQVKEALFERKALLRVVSARMSQYIIQIRSSRLKGSIPPKFSCRDGMESRLLWIPPGQLKDYYDRDTGFKDDGTAFLF